MNDLLLRTLAGASEDRAPVWLMRQAGRHLPEYRALKAKHDFWTLARTPELTAEVTLQPLRRYALDAAILFQDIMTPLPGMGAPLSFNPGPVMEAPIRDAASVRALRVPHKDEIAPFVGDAIKLIKPELGVPLIGFAGAPLTVATYLIEGAGSKDYPNARAFLRTNEADAHALMRTLTDATIAYLNHQIDAGVDAVQLFDSWAGLYPRPMYETFGFPYAREILQAVRDRGIPTLAIAVGSQHLLDAMANLPLNALSVDWRTPLDQARTLTQDRVAVLQGNLDPTALMGPEAALRAEVRATLHAGLGGPHVFNLGHGMLPGVSPGQVHALVDEVHRFSRHHGANSTLGGS
jgi:uroporphyrinogen decarboxylase